MALDQPSPLGARGDLGPRPRRPGRQRPLAGGGRTAAARGPPALPRLRRFLLPPARGAPAFPRPPRPRHPARGPSRALRGRARWRPRPYVKRLLFPEKFLDGRDYFLLM